MLNLLKSGIYGESLDHFLRQILAISCHCYSANKLGLSIGEHYRFEAVTAESNVEPEEVSDEGGLIKLIFVSVFDE